MSLRLKRHGYLLLLLILVIALFVVALGEHRIIAYTTQVTGASMPGARSNYTNKVDVFDNTLVHSIQIIMPPANYEKMLSTYRETGDKPFFAADVIIDGVRVYNVGVRLKGNASLRTALGRGGNAADNRGIPQAPVPVQPQIPQGKQAPQLPDERQMPQPGDRQAPQRPGDAQIPAPGAWGRMPAQPFGGAPAQAGMPGPTSTATKLPLLIRFDKFIAGQRYQGLTRLVIRTHGVSSDAAMLQEPVTNDIVRLAGLPATQTAYAGLRLNDGAEQLYVFSEAIDESYLVRYFANPNGVLYKAEVGSSLTYRGDDPSAYARSFTQKTRINDADMGPLIAFTRFLTQSDDATFERELPTHLDVDAFATYLALNNLLVNTDSIIGMNNNYYLYYDDIDKRFTLLMWDANEGLGKLAGGVSAATFDIYNTSRQGIRAPGGEQSILVRRFMESAAFRALYEQKLQIIYQQAFVDGAITRQVERYAALVREANIERALVTPANYDKAVTNVLNFIAQRGAYLATTPLLGN